jgi:hypothetical protein
VNTVHFVLSITLLLLQTNQTNLTPFHWFPTASDSETITHNGKKP